MTDPDNARKHSAAENDWELVWSDDFTGDTIDRTKWAFDIGNSLYVPEKDLHVPGWGNAELQYHTDRTENAFVNERQLHVCARKEKDEGSRYTSARMKTQGLFDKVYGRFEFRARFPVGRGLWPALALFPADNAYGPWAASGEIDVVENKGQDPSRVYGTIHYGSSWPNNAYASTDYLLPGDDSTEAFHTYSIEWEPGAIRWYVDSDCYSVATSWWSCSKTDRKGWGKPAADGDKNPWPAPFDRRFYLAIMLNVGGNVVGKPDKHTAFPAEMVVDYVRVHDKVGGYRE